MNRIVKFLKEKPLFILMLLWALIQFALFLRYDFVIGFEGLKYQNDANLLAQQLQLNFQRIFYASYSITIALLLKFGMGYYSVLIFQLVVNAWSNILFYNLLSKYVKQSAAIIISIIMIFTMQIQMWNFHLYTESLFVSGIVIFMYVVFSFDYSNKDRLKLVLSLIFLSYLRPIGISLAAPAVVYFMSKSDDNRNQRIIIVLILSTIIVLQFGLMYLLKDNFNEFFSVATTKFWIIGAYDTVNDYSQFSFLPDFIKAIILRFNYYFLMVRPYYSDFHNLLEMLFYPVYLLSFFGLYSMYKCCRPKLFFILTLIGIFTTFTIMSHINYHGRYISPILPLFLFIAAFGLGFIRKRFKSIFGSESN